MQIQTKYDIGQKIYFLTGFYYFNEVFHRCPICSGKWKRIMKGGEWRCKNCEEGKIKEEKESLSIEIDKRPFKVDGMTLLVDEKGLVDGERITVIRREKKSTTHFHFLADFDDKLNDDWTYLKKDTGVKKGLKFQKVHLTKISAEAEFERIEKILKEKYEKEKGKPRQKGLSEKA